MKKIFLSLGIVSLSTLALAGCGNQQSQKKEYEPKKTAVKSTQKESKKDESSNDESQESTQSNEQQSSSSSESSKTSSSSSAQKGWTLESAKDYYLATVKGNNGNPLKLVGDIPTQAQNGPTEWQNMGTSNNGQTMNVGISGTQIFTITNNGDGTSTIQMENITMKVRNSDHWILENNQQQ